MSTLPADALTTDGGIVSIRPVIPGDRQAIAALYDGAAPENLRLRFFAQPTAATLAAEVDRLCRTQSPHFLAMVGYEGAELVGVASCDRAGDGPRGDFAVFVADRHHGRGIGTLLLEHLAARARRHGITELTGEVLPSNTGMLRVAREFGPDGRAQVVQGIVDVTVDTGDVDCLDSVIDVRDRVAERASLRAVLAPATIAVVGAGHRPGGAGHEALRALQEYGFTGRYYAVNRSGAPVAGTPAHRALRDLPEPVQLLVVAVPADQIAGVLRDGAAAGARAAVILTGLPGPDGHRRRAELLRLARSLELRLIGPGSLGVLNTDSGVRLHAGLLPVLPPPGGLAIAAQAAAVALAMTEHAVRTGFGVSSLVSLGEKADVSGNELLSYWYDDPATTAVALHLTSFGNPARFARLAGALSRHKPVLALRDPRAPAAVDALFTQAGVIRTENLGELMDAARMLVGQPLPAGRRLAVVGNTAGLATIPGLGDADVLTELGSGAPAAEIAAAVESVTGAADLLLLVITGTRTHPAEEILAALAPVVDRHPALPVAAAVVGAGDPPPRLGARGVPVYDLPERAAQALAHAAGYARWRRTPPVAPAGPPGLSPPRARSLIAMALTEGSGRQPAARTAGILDAYGIRVAGRRPDSAVHLVAATVHDPLFGAMVLLGEGPARLPGEWAVRLTPLTEPDAAAMCRTLRRAPLLTGSGGTALRDLLLRLSRLAENHPEVAGLDLDVLAAPDGLWVHDADLRLAPAGQEPDPALRRLRGPDSC
ncbi:GNAT family N-acetyltransferase [Actinoplanes sp. L3-i22]|uniref:GNAT family N-acetyltransferase n=1 Tax=Actinoplanes sp. L3-i22 TaxID=2836373 RepID=UPI0027155E29|nr:GNAT family N-acetyltransferase [Actinoplanes sp. L3-i22]